MDLLGKIMSSAKKADIGFGIHPNCVILSASNAEKKTKENVVIKRNNYTTFGKLNENGDIVAEKEISWFNLKHDSEYVYDNFFTQLDQITGILDCFYEKDEDGNGVVSDKINEVFDEEEIESKEDLEDAVKNKSVLANLMKGITDAYQELLADADIGREGKQIRLKIVFDSKGKYLQQPKFDPFTESMEVSDEDSRLKITKNEAEYKLKSQATSAPSANLTGL